MNLRWSYPDAVSSVALSREKAAAIRESGLVCFPLFLLLPSKQVVDLCVNLTNPPRPPKLKSRVSFSAVANLPEPLSASSWKSEYFQELTEIWWFRELLPRVGDSKQDPESENLLGLAGPQEQGTIEFLFRAPK